MEAVVCKDADVPGEDLVPDLLDLELFNKGVCEDKLPYLASEANGAQWKGVPEDHCALLELELAEAA